MANESYGLSTAADLELLGGTVQSMDIEKLSRDQLREALDARVAARNRSINLIMGQLAFPTMKRGDLIGQTAEIGEWPKATEQDRGRRVKTSGITGVGYPIFKFGPVRTGWTYDALQRASNWDLFKINEEIMNGHKVANYKEALRALFRSTGYTWSNELFADDGTISVKPLVANEGDYIPPEWQGNTFDATHTHYNALGAGTLDEADLVTLAQDIREHGYGVDRSVGGYGGYIVVWINSDEKADVKAHTNFVGPNDPMVYDINKKYSMVDRNRYIGYNTSAEVLIREVNHIPSGYALAFCTDNLGDGVNSYSPLARRVPTAEGLRGMKAFDGADFPLQDRWYQDFFGYGVARRLTAAVGKLDASYTDPTI